MSNNARDTTAIYTRHVQYFLLNWAVNHKNICSLHKNVHCQEAKERSFNQDTKTYIPFTFRLKK